MTRGSSAPPVIASPWIRRLVRGIVSIAFALALARQGLLMCTHVRPPAVDLPPHAAVARSEGVRRLGRSHVKTHGGILQVVLEGSPEEIGWAHASLLREEMIENETALWSVLDEVVPSPVARMAVLDVSRWAFRDLDRRYSAPRKREIAAAATALLPDPFEERMPTWQRLLFLNALYDVSLFYEHSPLIGCSSVVVSGARAVDGHTLLARNFDFETHEVFDRGKAVIVVREEGRVPFLSVAWPGLVGVVTGMNARGVSIVVHGARARSPVTDGEPALLTVREALSRAGSTAEAATILAAAPPMVSHMVLVTDPSGDTRVVERAPGVPAHVRSETRDVSLSNHFEGPLAADPANLAIFRNTSTKARRLRLASILSRLPTPVSPTDLANVLRDRSGADDLPLPDGDRRAIDADIATHGVVMDATARRVWVSEGPHLRGRFVRFDLERILSPAYDPEIEDAIDPIAAR